MILVFGSVNIDLVVPAARLPQPGETMLGGDYALLPGGKGANQALAARRASAAVMLAGAVGNDTFADLALANLRREGVDLSQVRRVAKPTGCAAIVVDAAGENLIAVASGANREAAAAAVPNALLGPATVLVCQMEVPPAENWALIRRARAVGATIILNLAPAAPLDPAVLPDIDILVANRGEAATLGADPGAVARRLRRAFVVTHGAACSTAYLNAGGQLDTPTLPVVAVDTTGAGDTFVGVLAAGVEAGMALADALRRASAAAGLACTAQGAQTAMPDAAAIEAAAAGLPA
jgi:ribokinase